MGVWLWMSFYRLKDLVLSFYLVSVSYPRSSSSFSTQYIIITTVDYSPLSIKVLLEEPRNRRNHLLFITPSESPRRTSTRPLYSMTLTFSFLTTPVSCPFSSADKNINEWIELGFYRSSKILERGGPLIFTMLVIWVNYIPIIYKRDIASCYATALYCASLVQLDSINILPTLHLHTL